MQFDPEDQDNFGPHCRNCHKGSTACNACHTPGAGPYTADKAIASSLSQGKTMLDVAINAGTGGTNMGGFIKDPRTVNWDGWTTKEATASAVCSDDGFSWPHRTLGYMMLKDDLFGLDIAADGTLVEIGPGVNRTNYGALKTHDLDSVCIDCHNPTIFNATSLNHEDTDTITSDDYNDELLLRGLP